MNPGSSVLVCDMGYPWAIEKEKEHSMELVPGVRQEMGPFISTYEIQNPYLHTQIGVSKFNLDDDLLSHGEAPHYHRRCVVSLLSSGWDQVVPTLYGRQEILAAKSSFNASANRVCDICGSQNFRFFRLHHRNLLRLSAQIAWVLYGQASRAISIG